jgi:hypothetical protein
MFVCPITTAAKELSSDQDNITLVIWGVVFTKLFLFLTYEWVKISWSVCPFQVLSSLVKYFTRKAPEHLKGAPLGWALASLADIRLG